MIWFSFITVAISLPHIFIGHICILSNGLEQACSWGQYTWNLHCKLVKSNTETMNKAYLEQQETSKMWAIKEAIQ